MSVIEAPVISNSKADIDDSKRSHIVAPAWKVTQAYITGEAVTALCGKHWVPSRDPNRYPVCESCKDILEHIKDLDADSP